MILQYTYLLSQKLSLLLEVQITAHVSNYTPYHQIYILLMPNCHEIFSINNCDCAVSNSVLLILDKFFSISHTPSNNYLNFIDRYFSNSLGSLLLLHLGYEILLMTLVTDWWGFLRNISCYYCCPSVFLICFHANHLCDASFFCHASVKNYTSIILLNNQYPNVLYPEYFNFCSVHC